MAKAGYCDVCGESVWLDTDGSCLKAGHGPEHISGAQDTDLPNSPPPRKPKDKRRTRSILATIGLWMGVLIGVVLLCGILTAIVVPAFHTPRDTDKIQCFTNQRTVLEAHKRYRANGGKDVVTMDELVKAFNLTAIPKCPSGGKYEWDPVRHEITCSVHGTVMDQGPVQQP
jgi:hypothetical protein